MIAESEGKPGVPAFDPSQIIHTGMGINIQYKLLSSPFSLDPVKDFLLPDCSSRKELNTAFTEYTSFIAGLISGEQLQRIKTILDLSIYLPQESKDGDAMSMMSGLHSTELLKNSILTVETSMLRSVAGIH